VLADAVSLSRIWPLVGAETMRALDRHTIEVLGVPGEVLIDNAKALVKRHNAQTREVEFSTTFHAFARYWGFQPRACAPFRARTKGKDETAWAT